MSTRAVAPLVCAGFALWAASCSDGAGGAPSASTSAASARAPEKPVSASVTAGATAPPSASAAAAEEVAAQHILIRFKGSKNAPKNARSKDEAKKLAESIRQEALKGTDFSELVKKHSEDEATKDGLGSLGKFKRSEMTPAFSEAAFALKVGGISDLVETGFGFHIIKRNQ